MCKQTLMPCPICGERDNIAIHSPNKNNKEHVQCLKCGLKMEKVLGNNMSAISWWNNRKLENKNVYRNEIKIFKLKENINLPIKSNHNKTANCNIGDLLISYDGKNVYAKDWDDNEEESFVLLLNDLVFIESNEHFFECI